MPAGPGGELSNGLAAFWGQFGGSSLATSGGGFKEFSLKLGDSGDREEADRLDALGAFLLRRRRKRLERGYGIPHGHSCFALVGSPMNSGFPSNTWIPSGLNAKLLPEMML